ncbi:hypothetical protein EDB80DRAFT_740579 [Ilyonectria destructans]|nr:hypothetical protein EDB80DRAFT_740579 [Ilyonectria destructans]
MSIPTSRVTMASNKGLSLFFLNHNSTGSPPDEGQLNAAARAHASRQARLKYMSARPRNLKFIFYTPETMRHGTDSGPFTKPDDTHIEERQVPAIADTDRGGTDPAMSRHMSSCPLRPAGWDPFDSFVMSGMGRDEHLMLYYAFTNTWPQFGEFESGRRKFAQSWLWRTLESPAAFYAGLMGSSTHYTISCPTASIQNRILVMGLKWKIQAIRAVRSLIEQHQFGSPRGFSNSDLLAIFVLAIHGSMDLSDQPEPHPLSPLATYRHMHVYGRMKPGKEHMNAIYYIVEQKGGISNIDQHAFGFVLPILDLLYNARLDTPPRYPCSRQLKPMVQEGLWAPDLEAHQKLKTSGECFRPSPDAPLPTAPYLEPKMVKFLEVMAETTVALDHYCRGGPGAPDSLDVLANNCDWASHAILSLPPYIPLAMSRSDLDQQPNIDTTTILHEICRLCTLLYHDMVLLPSPPHAGIKLRHSTRVLCLIEVIQRKDPIEDPRAFDFLTWAMVIGGIAARFTKLQVSYSKLIEKVARDTAWEVIHPRLKRYIWFNPSFNVALLPPYY